MNLHCKVTFIDILKSTVHTPGNEKPIRAIDEDAAIILFYFMVDNGISIYYLSFTGCDDFGKSF